MDATLQIMPIPEDDENKNEHDNQIMPLPDDLGEKKNRQNIERKGRRINRSEVEKNLEKSNSGCASVEATPKEKPVIHVSGTVKINDCVVNNPKQNIKGKFNREIKQHKCTSSTLYSCCSPLKLTNLPWRVFLCMILLINTQSVESRPNIQWKILSEKIVFGEEAVLRCSVVTSNACNRTLQWTGGSSSSTLLTQNKGSTYPEKYKAQMNENCSTYDLHISNFSEQDVNKTYICKHGFESVNGTLQLDSKKFEGGLDDVNIECNITVTEKGLAGYIQFKEVYPRPDCRFLYGTKTLHANESSTGDILKLVTWIINETFTISSCHEKIYSECIFGEKMKNRTHKISNCSIDNDKKDQQDKTNTVTDVLPPLVAVLCSALLLALVALVAFGLYRLIKKTCLRKGVAQLKENDIEGHKVSEASSSEKSKMLDP